MYVRDANGAKRKRKKSVSNVTASAMIQTQNPWQIGGMFDETFFRSFVFQDRIDKGISMEHKIMSAN